MCFRSVYVENKLELDDGAAGGRQKTKSGDENDEEEFELVIVEFGRKCGTPVSLLHFGGGEEDIAMQNFGFLLDFDLLSRVSCSQFSMRNIIFDEAAVFGHVREIHASGEQSMTGAELKPKCTRNGQSKGLMSHTRFLKGEVVRSKDMEEISFSFKVYRYASVIVSRRHMQMILLRPSP